MWIWSQIVRWSIRFDSAIKNKERKMSRIEPPVGTSISSIDYGERAIPWKRQRSDSLRCRRVEIEHYPRMKLSEEDVEDVWRNQEHKGLPTG